MSMVNLLCVLVVLLSFLNFGMASAMSTFMTGAHSVVVIELDDITTLNTKDVFTAADEAGRVAIGVNEWVDGKLVRAAWNVPKQLVPGYQITGMYEDAKFVLRIPKNWNGKLVVSASGGLREETAFDTIISDYVLTKFDANGASYAYACTDKGTRGETIPDFMAGQTTIKNPGLNKALSTFAYAPKPDDPAGNDSAAEWGYRLRQLAAGAKEAIMKLKGKAPGRIYAFGVSNGGFSVRLAMEHNEDNLIDGGIDWEGVLWRADDNNLLAVFKDLCVNHMIYTNYIKEITGKDATPEERTKAKAEIDKWLPPESEFTWNTPAFQTYFWSYWLPSLSMWSLAADPDFIPGMTWSKIAANPKDYMNWDYYKRPDSVRAYFRKFENTGKINKPLITVQGNWDVLIPLKVSALPYRALIEKNGNADLHRLYIIDQGSHLDGWVGDPKRDPDKKLQALMPYGHQAFDMLVEWVENGKPAPANMTVPVPSTHGKVIDIRTGNEITPY
jgi:hypothetical protein